MSATLQPSLIAPRAYQTIYQLLHTIQWSFKPALWWAIVKLYNAEFILVHPQTWMSVIMLLSIGAYSIGFVLFMVTSALQFLNMTISEIHSTLMYGERVQKLD